MKIRAATHADRDAIWKIFHEVIAGGDTYTFDRNISREDALAYWLAPGTHTYVARQKFVGDGVALPGKPTASPEIYPGEIAGTYILRPNQSGGGSHVANAAFMVALDARGQGIGRAMQFNFVVSTNESAVRLWKQLGFKIVGTLPGAFRHPEKGYVDVYVMFRSLP